MRVLEVRRHSYTKKGAGRGVGSHLSSDGVRLARRIGIDMGPFDRVVASPVPRTLETALAMGFAVDELIDELAPSGPDLFREIGHHERWVWEEPFVVFARLVRQGGATARLGQSVASAWWQILQTLPTNGRGLAISHGRVIECGAVSCEPSGDHATWGPPFRHCEGVRIVENVEGELSVDLLRIDQSASI